MAAIDTVNNEINQDNHETIDLAQYTIEHICNGILNDDAFGYKNYKCPENRGYDSNDFEFDEDDIKYTEKFHTNVDTQTHAADFTKSSDFTFSYKIHKPSKIHLFILFQFFLLITK